MSGMKGCLPILAVAAASLFGCMEQRPSVDRFAEEKQSHLSAAKAEDAKEKVDEATAASTLSEADKTLIAKDVELKEARVASLTEELELLQTDRETSIVRMKQEIEEKEAERAQLELDVQQKVTEIATKDTQIKDMNARVLQFQRANDNIRSNIVFTRNDLINCRATRAP